MKTRIVSATVVLFASTLLSGCSLLLITEEEQWPADQRQANVQGAVLADEDYTGFAVVNHMRVAHAPESVRRYRKVVVLMHKGDDDQPLFGNTGFGASLALVPDGMPQLKKGDLVEFRHVRKFGGLEDFDKTGDGNAVLRLLCPSSPDSGDKEVFRSCASHAKWQARWGEKHRYYMGILASPSGRPYAKHLKDHRELSFSPYYDENGHLLPGAVPMGPRPDIRRWSYPVLEAAAASTTPAR